MMLSWHIPSSVVSFDHFYKSFLALSPRAQAGFFIWPSLTDAQLTENEIHLLQEVQPSGMVLFRRNFASLMKAKSLCLQLKNLCESKGHSAILKPFIISIDEEGGAVSRLPLPFPRGDGPFLFAQKNDLDGLLNQISHQIAVAKHLGINCFLAPVADILTEPSNPVMANRCLGSEAEQVSQYAGHVHNLLLENGLFSCAKHFPGHGHTTTDTHKALATTNVDLHTLQTREWLPFQSLIEHKVPMIMAAHVMVPALDPGVPATLSKKILTDVLRHQLKFEGLILSDDLRMDAIALHYHNAPDALIQASFAALDAGCDILLACHSIEKELDIIDAIAHRLQHDNNYTEQMAHKAYRIYRILNVYGFMLGWM